MIKAVEEYLLAQIIRRSNVVSQFALLKKSDDPHVQELEKEMKELKQALRILRDREL